MSTNQFTYTDASVAIWLPLVSTKPTTLHPGGNRVRIKMPYEPYTRHWLRGVCGPGTRPEFERDALGGGTWTVARPHFATVVNALAKKYGEVFVMQDFTEKVTCCDACQRATSDVTMCECSCLGTKHGQQGASVTRSDWTNGTVYAYHDFTRRTWVATEPPEPPTPHSTMEPVTFDSLMRMMANQADARHTRSAGRVPKPVYQAPPETQLTEDQERFFRELREGLIQAVTKPVQSTVKF